MPRASLNHTFRLIWSETTRAWVAVSEITRAGGKRKSSVLTAITLLSAFTASSAFALDAGALPSGGTVGSGSATIGQSGTTMTITQQSQNVAINWPDFNVGGKATLNFVQPNSSAIAVNRVYGTNGTQILGNLNANGQVWIINPNGVLFGSGAQVNVGGLVASTLGLSDDDFKAGKRTFSGKGGTVVNQGTINANYVALLGEQARNEGVIVARLGTVALGAGNEVTLDFTGDRLIGMQVDKGALKAVAENKGLIEADGGAVLMTAKAKDALIETVVNNTGIIRARTLENHEGRIMLIGDMGRGTTMVGGTLDAGAPDGGNGGFIETSAAHVKVADDAHVTTKAASGNKNGTWLIDPVDFTVAASGGDMTGAAVSNALANGNFIIQSTSGGSGTAGDININDVVSWNANILTLKAQNDINIRAQMNGSGSAGLALEYGQANLAAGNTAAYNINAPVNLASTGSFSTKLGSDGGVIDYTIITSLGAAGSTTGADLQGMNGNWSRNYVLGADIDASATAGWNGGAGFMPVAQVLSSLNPSYFSGRFDGLGHVIDGLTINRPDPGATGTGTGLFGTSKNASFANVGLTHVSILGHQKVGALLGYAEGATVSNSYSTGSVTGINDVGGLVGKDAFPHPEVVLRNVYSTADVTATVPGTGRPVDSGSAGGLIGAGGIIENGYATGTVTGGFFVGGLVGKATFSRVSNSYFAGTLVANGTPYGIGAIIGGTILSGPTNILTNVYWNTDTVGTVIGATGSNVVQTATNVAGLSTAQMRDAANWVGFDFTNTAGGSGWVLTGGDGSLNGSNGTVLPMLASEWSSVVRNAHQLQLMALDKSASYTLANDIDAGATDGSSSAGAHDVWMGSSFASVGGTAAAFTGDFDGLGHKIDGLTIDRPGTDDVGLFGAIADSKLANVGLTNVAITGKTNVGGLVGVGSNSIIDNAYVEGGTVSGDTLTQLTYVGGLAGGFSGTIDNSHATVDVSGYGLVGGLVGQLGGLTTLHDIFASYLTNSYATGKVTATGGAGGGLAGQTQGYLYNVYATGDVTGGDDSGGAYLGGLIGMMNAPEVNDTSYNFGLFGAYATGNVTSTALNAADNRGAYVGGLVGRALCACGVNSVFATGNVTGSFNVGGLFGEVSGLSDIAPLIITNAYAKDGTVTGAYAVGGLIGQVKESVWLFNVWTANGTLTTTNAGTRPGGLIGRAVFGSGLNGFDFEIGGVWNKETSGAQYTWGEDNSRIDVPNSTGGAATTAQMMQRTAYDDTNNFYMDGPFWGGVAILTDDLATTAYDPAGNPSINGFRLYEGESYPLLRFFLKSADVTVSGTKAYDGTTTVAPSDVTYSVAGITPQGSLQLSGANAGSYDTFTGIYSTGQFGYDYLYNGSSSYTVTPKALTINGSTASGKTYDGTTVAGINAGTLSGLVGSETLGVTATGAFDSANAGTRSADASYTLADGGNGGLASNYTLADTMGLAATIDKATLTVTGGFNAADKAYDGNAEANIVSNSLGLNGILGSDTVTADWLAAFSGPLPGTDKTVTLGRTVLGGSDGGNYAIDFAGAPTAFASITGEVPVAPQAPQAPVVDIPKPLDDPYYAGAVASANAGNGKSAGDSADRVSVAATTIDPSTLANFTVRDCGMNLPADLKGGCR
ncbi:MAG TPA: filamentous hemagglutinin N-terminal domain-containing protein [Herbaspirillum sp.]|jgi:filamentous hemagglutinin family protein